MSEEDLNACIDALWDNAIDGRLADKNLGSDFDEAERLLRESFVAYLSGVAR